MVTYNAIHFEPTILLTSQILHMRSFTEWHQGNSKKGICYHCQYNKLYLPFFFFFQFYYLSLLKSIKDMGKKP